MHINRALKNVISNIAVQFIVAITGFWIPRLILNIYGSEVNGMVSAISQFIGYASLVEMGIGNASVLALYCPITNKDIKRVSEIITSTKSMYCNSAVIYSIIMLLFSFIYPLLYAESLDYWSTFWLVVCIGSVNAVDFFFLGKYKVLLTADRKYYILNIARIVSTLLQLGGSILLINGGYSIIAVKCLVVGSRFVELFCVKIYVNVKYSNVSFWSRNKVKIEQRWNALVHQICSTVVYNTDIVVLSLFLPKHSLLEISVYSVYSLALGFVTNMASILTSGIDASFGNMIAKNEKERLKETFFVYEYIYLIFVFVIASCFISLCVPFVGCYTKGVGDVNYIRPLVAILFAFNGLSSQVKNASGVVINASGKYKETQKYAISEALINIVISLALVKPFGIVGVLVGTLISHIVMSCQFILFMNKNIIPGCLSCTVKRLIRNGVTFILLAIGEMTFLPYSDKWNIWIVEALIVGAINLLIFVGINELHEKKLLLKKLCEIRNRRIV